MMSLWVTVKRLHANHTTQGNLFPYTILRPEILIFSILCHRCFRSQRQLHCLRYQKLNMRKKGTNQLPVLPSLFVRVKYISYTTEQWVWALLYMLDYLSMFYLYNASFELFFHELIFPVSISCGSSITNYRPQPRVWVNWLSMVQM